MTDGFVERPGRPGAFGALMDEYARAAEDFCAAVEALSQEAFDEERTSDDADTASLRSMCHHVCRAARGYANGIRGVLEMSVEPPEPPFREYVDAPADVRPALAAQLRFTESTVESLHGRPWKEVMALEYQVSWGKTYDPEMILEHAICHLLRHRRQIERW